MYKITEIVPDHAQGRCTSVPVVKGMPPVEWASGEEWLLLQDEATQRSILGAGRFEAWQDGAFEFGDLVTRTRDAVWGEGVRPTPLSELVG